MSSHEVEITIIGRFKFQLLTRDISESKIWTHEFHEFHHILIINVLSIIYVHISDAENTAASHYIIKYVYGYML